MESFIQPTGFQYISNPNTIPDPEEDFAFSGILEIYVHHARNIHNICIYDKQDVYAKFSLTYNPDETLSTRIIPSGGKNPEFNEKLDIKVTQLDGILKCEIWMLSRDRSYMEDQLLGFALVPISQVVGKGEVTQDYSLSSTDLIYSPAGTIKLTLSMKTSSLIVGNNLPSSSISSEVVLLNRQVSEVELDPSKIEFPDISMVRENQQMVSEYFDGLNSRPGSFLHLGAFTDSVPVDYDMNMSSASPNGSIQSSGFPSSTMTSVSVDRISFGSMEEKSPVIGPSSSSFDVSITSEANCCSGACSDTLTSSNKGIQVLQKDPNFRSNQGERKQEGNVSSAEFCSQVYSAALGSISTIDTEQAAMQQQIIDMYMKSMQQFTESISKMKLPMVLDKPGNEDHGDLIQVQGNKPDAEKKKKDGSRVFYGSRAFF